MPKRGQRHPWRMSWTWPNGVKGSSSHRTEQDANDAADRQRATIGPDGLANCTATVHPPNRPAQRGDLPRR